MQKRQAKKINLSTMIIGKRIKEFGILADYFLQLRVYLYFIFIPLNALERINQVNETNLFFEEL